MNVHGSIRVIRVIRVAFRSCFLGQGSCSVLMRVDMANDGPASGR
jgi:hypothetical protein